MEGTGKLYSGGTVIYEGDFAGGTFEGSGRAYDPLKGRLVYDGAFAAGKYQGQGRLFNAETGALIYEGGFYQGVYEGDGTLYDSETGLPIYQGGFRAGRYDGTGTEYDAVLGTPVYKGEFLLGVYHGAGTQYDPATGFVTASGQYRNGQLVVIGENGQPEGEITAPENPGTAGGTGTAGGGSTGGNTGGSQAEARRNKRRDDGGTTAGGRPDLHRTPSAHSAVVDTPPLDGRRRVEVPVVRSFSAQPLLEHLHGGRAGPSTRRRTWAWAVRPTARAAGRVDVWHDAATCRASPKNCMTDAALRPGRARRDRKRGGGSRTDAVHQRVQPVLRPSDEPLPREQRHRADL